MAKIALVFSGQGAQKSGMGKSFYDSYAASRGVFEMAGEEITRLCFEGTEALLSQTINTQPCVFCADLAAAYALREGNLKISGAAGFSLGEIPALCFCNMLSPSLSYDLVVHRAQFMDCCAKKTQGFMAAVLKLDAESVKALCERCGVYAVNYNCASQTVVSGAADKAEGFFEAAKEAGARCVRLAVSGAFHSPYMKEASDKLYEYMARFDFAPSSIPLYSNVTAKPYEAGSERTLLARQVSSAVLWQQTIENMAQDGFDTFIEVGVGNTLTSLIKRILPEAETFCVTNASEAEKCLKEKLQ